MIFKTQLVFASMATVQATAKVPGPASPANTGDGVIPAFATDWSANLADTSTWAAADWATILKEGTDVVGGYACMRMGQMYAPPQKVDYDVAAATGASTLASTYLYGVTDADAGTAVNADGANANFPNGGDSNSILWAFGSAVLNTTPYQQCCSTSLSSSITNAATVATAACTSVVNVATNGTDTTYDSASYALTGRLFFNSTNLVVNGSEADKPAVDSDFILSAMGQISDENAPADNYCTQVYFAGNNGAHYFANATATAADVSLKTGSTFRIKCTWQFAAVGDAVPNMQLKSSTESGILLQWIEWSTNAQASGPQRLDGALFTDQSGVAFRLSDGVAASQIWWPNPFKNTAAGGATYQVMDGQNVPVALTWATDYWFRSSAADTSFLAGSIGAVDVYMNNAPATSVTEPEVTTTGVDSAIVLSQYASAQAAFDAVTAAADKYTTDLAAYNQSVKDYNTALDETPDEAKMSDIIARPSPPTAAGAYYGIPLKTAYDFNVATDADQDGSGAIFAVLGNMATGRTDAWFDSRRLGYSFTYGDNTSAATKTSSIGGGHTFGRLGEAYDSAAVAHRWAGAADTSAYLNWLQLSIFPEDNTFTAYSGATDATVVTVSPSTIGTFAPPSPGTVTKGTFTEVTGASALVASTMALATLTYTLF